MSTDGADAAAADAVHPPRVLVVDDEMTIRAALRRFFTKMGWRVDEAANGESALSMLLLDVRQDEIPPYTLVVSDLRMPGLSGFELHHRLKELHPEILRRLVFSTGDTVSEEAATFLRSSECAVLQKPFEFAMLRATIDRVLAQADR